VPCPHSGLQVGGRCYFCLKVAATNGHRDRLSEEQLAFVGFVLTEVSRSASEVEGPAWLQPTNPSNIDKQLEELERLRDIAPGWIRLARELVKDDKS
jgi:hypothetical protein